MKVLSAVNQIDDATQDNPKWIATYRWNSYGSVQEKILGVHTNVEEALSACEQKLEEH